MDIRLSAFNRKYIFLSKLKYVKAIILNMRNEKVKKIITTVIIILFCVAAVYYKKQIWNDNKQTDFENKLEYECDDNTNSICHVQGEITENMEINADIPCINDKSLMIYMVSGKKFDLEYISLILGVDIGSSEYYETTTNDYISYEDSENKYIGTNQHGYLEFYTVDYAYDLENSISEAYSLELNNFNEEEFLLESRDVVESVIEMINRIYSPKENEKVVLLEGIKVEKEKIVEYEKALEENGIIFGTDKSDFHSVSECISDEMYYLNFGIELDGILEESSSNMYYNIADANKNVSWVNINVIVEDGEIIFLYMGGLYELKECQSCSVLSVEEAVDVLKDKYNLEIINSLQNITKVDIKYVFYDDVYSDEELEGYIMPYWCFENTTSNFIDRINAITGDDFEYE